MSFYWDAGQKRRAWIPEKKKELQELSCNDARKEWISLVITIS